MTSLTVVEGLELSEFAKEKLKITENELLEEREAARGVVKGRRKRSLSVVSSSPPPSLSTSESEASLSACAEDGQPRIMSRM